MLKITSEPPATSLAEGFGMVFLESWLAECPLLGRDLPEITRDFVEAGGVSGVVEEIQLFTTQLRTGDNKTMIVPNGKITGDAITNYSLKGTRRIDMVVGVSYGDGVLHMKAGGSRKVFWQGPSIGFDLGGDASKVFVLVYDLPSAGAIFQRFPGVDGSFYYVGGVGVNYQRSEGIVLAPIRAGVGLRARASVGYMHYTRKRSWIPF